VEPDPFLNLTAGEKKLAAEFFAKSKNRKVGLFLGGRGIRKWETGKWFETGRKLADRGFSVFIFYGTEEEKEAGAFTPQAGIKVVEPGPIREFAAMLSGLDLFIASATGPLHLASALGVPVVGLYFPPDLPKRYAPPGKVKTLLYKEKNGMTPDFVAETALKILAPSGKMPVQAERAAR
jgi:ADP-heptose:LPS heptosyltransferase